MLAGAFPEEIHGHGVTLVPLGAVMCVRATALPKHAWVLAACFLGGGTLLAKVFGLLSDPHTAHERKSFDATQVEVVSYPERLETS